MKDRTVKFSTGKTGRVEIDVVGNNLVVACPANDGADFSAMPMHRDQSHVLLRPFDKFLRRGPPVGDIHYGILVDPPHRNAWIPYALAVLRDGPPGRPHALPFRRLILYVGSRRGLLFATRPLISTPLIPHHITFDAHNDGTLRGHASFSRDERGRKLTVLSGMAVPSREFREAHLGTFLLSQPESVEEAGFALRPITKGLRTIPDRLLGMMRESVGGSHPVHQLERPWSKDEHLQFNVILARQYPPRRGHHLPLIGRTRPWIAEIPREFATRAIGIQLSQDYWLTVTCAMLPGQPTGGADAWMSWKDPSRRPRPWGTA